MSRPPPTGSYPPPPRGSTYNPPFPLPKQIKNEPHPSHPYPLPQQTPTSRHAQTASTPDLNEYSYGSPEEDEELLGSAAGRGGVGGGKNKPATRRRVVQSCSECRRRKIKCDKKFPCGPCILRSDQTRCHEVGLAERSTITSTSTFATTSDLSHLAHRLDALESSLIKTGSLLPTDLDHFLKSSNPNHNPSTHPHLPTQIDRPPPQPLPPAGPPSDDTGMDDTEGAALTLEHLAFGRSRVEGSHSLPHFGARLPSTIGRSWPDNAYHLNRSSLSGPSGPSPVGSPLNSGMGSGGVKTVGGMKGKGEGMEMTHEEREKRVAELVDLLGPTDVFDLFYKKTDVALVFIAKVLPSRERGELLVRAYLEKVDWLHRCMHIPTFLKQCDDLWSITTDMVVHDIALPFVAIYLIVCTLGMQFMDCTEVEKHFTVEEAHTLPDLWYNAARSSMWAADFMSCHTTESLQALLLMSVFMNNRDRADAAWALLGAGIKMAQGLGLSRLGAEQQATEGKPLPMWTGRWGSLVQREVGRRIWWNLVFLDWALAPSYNFSCSIHPDQIKTALPANVEDEDLIDGQPLRVQPLHVRTGMSFQLARLKFAEISHRQIWQANMSNHAPYSFILSVDGELRKAMMELPAFFQPDPNASTNKVAKRQDSKEKNVVPGNDNPNGLVQYYEKIMLNLAIHSRMLRLHRPWLSRGYEDERFAYSKEQCIRAARASLRMMGENNECASFLEKWWIPLFYVSVSGLVVIIDLLRTARRDMHSTETEQKISEVKGALDQMRRIADVSHPSRAAVKVMDFLMAEVEERRKPGSTLGKRKASQSPSEEDEESGLQRAVKKLIRQAQLEADSPSHSGSNHTPSQNTNTALPHNTSPKTARELDMRIFSDTPRDRPVFGAYPMIASNPSVDLTQQSLGNGNGMLNIPINNSMGMGQNSACGGQPGGLSPFSYPQDPSLNPTFNFPAYQNMGTPQLDPAVESMLASYFPTGMGMGSGSGNGNGMDVGSGGQPGASVPDDFLSRVFNFGWEAPGVGGAGVASGMQQVQGGLGGGQRQGQMGQGQAQRVLGQGEGQGQFEFGLDAMDGLGGNFEGWSSHGWMA